MLREAGLKNVRIDAEGNVIAERPGTNPRPNVVVSAHLDTVFPRGTNVKVRRDGYMLRGPGIGDDCRGLADLLAVARALNKAGVTTPGTITFVATVGEEGLGDLRGVKRLFNETLKDRIDRFVSIDGEGLGVTYIAIGSARFRVTFKGPGGHSFGSFGVVNPIHAMGRAMARIADFQVPSSPRTTFNVGRIGGGTSINTISSEAWMEVDLRSGDTASLRALEKQFRQAVNDAVAQENARWNSSALTVTIETVGMRPAGRLPSSAPIVQAAISVSKALNLPLSFSEGSTDANLPLSLGIPALSIDAGGRGYGRAHGKRNVRRDGRLERDTACASPDGRARPTLNYTWITRNAYRQSAPSNQADEIQAQHRRAARNVLLAQVHPGVRRAPQPRRPPGQSA